MCGSLAPFSSPCFYGVDTSTYEELISARMDVDELCTYINADTLKFMTIEQMREAIRRRICVFHASAGSIRPRCSVSKK